MKKEIIFVAIVSLLVLAGFVLTSHAKGPSDSVKIIMLKGNPKIMKSQKTAWENCAIEMPVASGDRIKTASGELVDIAFTLRSTIAMRIEENSDVFIKNNMAPYSIDLLNGAVMASIKNLTKGSGFEVRTPTAVSGARGTAWRSATNGNTSVFDAFEKSVYIRGIDAAGNEMKDELKLNSGFRAVVDRFERPSRVERLSGADRQKWSEWRSEMRGGAAGGPGSMDNRLDKIDDLATKAGQAESRRESGVLEAEDVTRIDERLTNTDRTNTSSHITHP